MNTAEKQSSELVSDVVVSPDGAWAALALHHRVEVFDLQAGKHHGHLPVFEVRRHGLISCQMHVSLPKGASWKCQRDALLKEHQAPQRAGA
jgi:hypothetical protein